MNADGETSRVVPEGIATISDRLRASARAWPDAEVVFPEERASFAELDRRVDEFTDVLIAAGVRRGEKVAILLDPGLDFVATLFAIARAGATIVAINDRLKAAEIRHVVGHSDSVVVVTAGDAFVDFPSLLTGAFEELSEPGASALDVGDAPSLRRIILLRGDLAGPSFTRLDDLVDAASAVSDTERAAAVDGAGLGDIAYVMYTSGTSAQPKGCLITHEAAIRQGETMAHTRYMIEPGEAFWCPLPLFHNGGLASLMVCLASGATYVHAGHFDPATSLRMLSEERCTHAIPAFETILMRILDHPDFATRDLSALRVILNVGSPERLREFQSRLPHAIQISNYGLTEAAGHLTVGHPDDPDDIRLTTGGHPLPDMEVRVVDPETGVDLPAGTVGEIVFRGPTRTAGYFKQPEVTASTIDADGWLHSGDLGVLDDEGRLTFRGRLKDMMKVGGENVAATEVEGFLVTHPAVNIAVVVAVSDAIYTEVPAAFVELVPGATATEEEIIGFCLGSIATYKVPRYVRFVDEWPMSGTKVKKYVLRERIAAELADAAVTAAPGLSSETAR